ncbi:hypothetical protein Pint_08234 [Pistacia integerrima]|uniref:Uncharacterized protein n=1 Tax=Pistacia integerrima TaxID=434235 RepID=A0ACC0XVE0_9ROSI|nr:hypothetical protein Pint_08234 [Pistacia integerrima]
MEQLQTALQDRGLIVTDSPEKGRCLFTTRDFCPGEVILSQEALSCQVVWYCGSDCQKLEWKLHRLECQVLSRLDKDRRKSVKPSIRLMIKLYLRRKLQSEKLYLLVCFDCQVIPTTAMDSYNLVEALVARSMLFLNNFLGKDMSDIDEKQLVLYAQMANLVNLILQWQEINIKEIAENFSKVS